MQPLTMTDVTIKTTTELQSAEAPGVPEGQFRFAGGSLGVQAFGMNLLTLPPNWDGYPKHDHGADGHEEVYVVLEGSGTLQVGERSWPLHKGTFVRVGPAEVRKILPGASGIQVLALGGSPGKAYTPSWGQQR